MAATSILVVEDDVNLLELLVETLEDVGYFVQGASAPDEALSLARRFRFDLVISDVRMAGSTDGLGVLAAIKQARPDIRTIVITGYASEDAPARAIKIQVDDYVYKPFRLPAMLETIKRVMRSDSERAGYAKLLSSLLSAPKRWKEKAEANRIQAAQTALDQERDRTLQGYFVGIRSNLLSRGAALDLWDELERLESHYSEQLGSDNPLDLIVPLGRGYRQVYELMTGMAQSQSIGSFKGRQAGQVTRVNFNRFYDAVKSEKLTSEQLRIAFCLQKLQHPETNPELAPLYELLYGAP